MPYKYEICVQQIYIGRISYITFNMHFKLSANKPGELIQCELIKEWVGSFHPLAQAMWFLCQLYLAFDTKLEEEDKQSCAL